MMFIIGGKEPSLYSFARIEMPTCQNRILITDNKSRSTCTGGFVTRTRSQEASFKENKNNRLARVFKERK